MTNDLPPTNRNGIEHMRNAVLFEGTDRGQRLSRFWILLILASTIAAAGIVAESTAAVIGAMIVAPMMLPIQGTMLSTVLGDRVNLVRSIALMATGAAVAIGIGFIVGLLVANDVVAATNNQVAGRVHPGLIDLLAALATGVVGSFALIRRDISDTLPGVAIAISLVPPLVVSGLTLESGAFEESLGALLLFVTNVASILATGVVVMALFKVQRSPALNSAPAMSIMHKHKAGIAITTMLVLVAIPLTISSINTGAATVRENTIRAAAEQWADEAGWDLVTVNTGLNRVFLRVTGPLPAPDTDELAAQIAESGIDPSVVEVELVPSRFVNLETPSSP
ncbi:DUF389 domain-containing protein [Salinibacterium sp. NG22]|uniref:DUF389 domain-containing protein n=1 Tax=Salinibacterium sp. NG22 TaxID=2792040 RepID=UPI0018CDF034|nr:DUF389 domain-containing protein [Salinibacterium sp. NG22]MBH0110228.1 DUF389 domain-containing protein [Salinibacterium sp. NG22]